MQTLKCSVCFVVRQFRCPLQSPTSTSPSIPWEHTNQIGQRLFSQTAVKFATHYDVLGISPKATQADIKSAYYRLSKIYHPDRSGESTESVQKFRDITTAYEILSNFRTRRLYDKGMYTGGVEVITQEQPAQHDDVVTEDDDQTRFYKRHMHRSKAPQRMDGRTPIYNFDAWNDAHYGKTFARRQEAIRKRDVKDTNDIIQENASKNEILILGTLIGIVFITVIIFKLGEVHDQVKRRNT